MAKQAVDLRGKVKSDFPKHTLDQAMAIPAVLEETNGGRPLPPTDVAIGLKISPGGSDFRIRLSSSLKYNLTSGSYKQERITLTDLGRRIVAPMSEEDRHQALLAAALAPETFRRMYEYFKGKKLPELAFFQNAVVREFDVPREHAAKCIEIFCANMERVGLVRNATTGKWLSSEAVPPPAQIDDEASEDGDVDAQGNGNGHGGDERGILSARRQDVAGGASPQVLSQPSRPEKNAIFIGHGKNKRPLEQLKHILDHYHIPYRVATDEANAFRPISEKVAETMRECGAAIVIFTADEQFKDMDGNVVWRPSENVVHELGAASILYGGKIIVFKEDAVKLPSNFSGIGYVSFAKDDLSAKAHDLFVELVKFQLIKISVGV